VTTVERAVILHAPPDPLDSLEHEAAERRQAPRRRLRVGWSLAGAGVLLISFTVAPGVEGALGGALGLVMLGIVSVDARRFVVPNVLSAGAFALGVIHGAVASPDSSFEGALTALSRAAFAAGLFLLLRIAYRHLRGRDGLGFGDVKLAGAAGAWLSLPMLPISIEIAAVTALAAYVLRQRKRSRILRAAGRVPFGAFFAPAIWLGWMLDTMIPILNSAAS
jgi:leader peptidase (prepilin peptidase) / N-methyltransferase